MFSCLLSFGAGSEVLQINAEPHYVDLLLPDITQKFVTPTHTHTHLHSLIRLVSGFSSYVDHPPALSLLKHDNVSVENHLQCKSKSASRRFFGASCQQVGVILKGNVAFGQRFAGKQKDKLWGFLRDMLL